MTNIVDIEQVEESNRLPIVCPTCGGNKYKLCLIEYVCPLDVVTKVCTTCCGTGKLYIDKMSTTIKLTEHMVLLNE